MKTLLIFLVVLSFVSIGAAQSDPSRQNLAWSYDTLYNGKNQQTFSSNGALQSYPGDRVDWVQGDNVQSFHITALTGTWTDTSVAGSLQFSVQWGDSSGTITFTNDNSGLYAILSLTNPGRAASYFKFYFSNVSAQ